MTSATRSNGRLDQLTRLWGCGAAAAAYLLMPWFLLAQWLFTRGQAGALTWPLIEQARLPIVLAFIGLVLYDLLRALLRVR